MNRYAKQAVGFLLAAFLNASAISQTSTECEQSILSDKRFAVLIGKVDLLNSANQTTAILANSKTPSAPEKAAISDWIEEIKRCSNPGIEYHRQRSPEVGDIFEKAYLELYLSAADLYAGKITYGKFALDSVKRHSAVRAQISSIVAKFNVQQAESSQRAAESTKQEQIRTQNSKQQNCFALKQSIDNLSQTNTALSIEAQRIVSANAEMERQRQLEIAKMNVYQRNQYQWQETGRMLGSALSGGQTNQLAILDQQYRQNRINIQQQQVQYQRDCSGE